MKGDDKLVLYVVIGLVVFWAIAIPAVALSKPFGGNSQ